MKVFTAVTEKKLKIFSKKPEKKYRSLIFLSVFVTSQEQPAVITIN